MSLTCTPATWLTSPLVTPTKSWFVVVQVRMVSNNVDGVFGFFPCSFSGFVQVLFSRLLKTSEDSIAYGVTGLGFMNIHG
jgi:hypothetical protein